MKKTLILFTSIICMLFTANYTAHAVAVDVSSGASWLGYMTVFDNNNGAQGGSLFGNNWGVADLATSWASEVVTFSPNTNGYTNSLGGINSDRAYWTNSSDGGVTAGPDGNKFMEASFYREADGNNTAWNGQTLTFSGNVSAFTLNNRYSTVAFIKTLDANNSYATVQNETASITSTGDFSLTLDVSQGSNFIAQIGFTMTGLNANPNTDWGNIQFQNLAATAVPEPSTYALLAGFVAFFFTAIRRRK